MSKCWHQPKRVVLIEGSQRFCFVIGSLCFQSVHDSEGKYTLTEWGLYEPSLAYNVQTIIIPGNTHRMGAT